MAWRIPDGGKSGEEDVLDYDTPKETGISITLDNNATQGRRVYTNGDVLHGVVNFRSRNITISLLTIKLICAVANTYVADSEGTEVWRFTSQVLLYEHSSDLVSSPTKILGSPSPPYPFSLVIPEKSEPHQTQTSIPPAIGFSNKTGTALPSTLTAGDSYQHAQVRWYLEATATFKPHLGHDSSTKTITARASFTFSPTISTPIQTNLRQRSTPIQFKTHRLSSTPPTTLFRKLTTPTPRALFTVDSHAPTHISLDSPIPISFNLAYKAPSSTATTQPPVTLQSIHAVLLSQTILRTRLTLQPTAKPRMSNPSSTETRANIWKATLSDQNIPEQGLELHTLTPFLALGEHVKLDGGLVPNFNCCTMKRTYVLRVTAVLGCLGESVEVRLAEGGVVILPRCERMGGMGEGLGEGQGEGEDEEDLPPYEDGEERGAWDGKEGELGDLKKGR